jgi:PAS domain S-box-containing protein
MQGKTPDLVKVRETLQAVIAERKQAEQEVRLLLSIIDAVCGAEEFNDAIRATLQKVCDTTGWHCAEAWLPSLDHSVLECAPVWYCRDKCVEEFRRVSEGLTCTPGVGLVGRAWVAKKPEWVRNVSAESETRFVRARIAREAGLKAALAVPIMAGEEVLAVLVFFMLEARGRDRRLVEIVSAAAAHLGSVIRHKRLDQELSKARAELEQQVRKRTAALAETVKELHDEIVERKQAEEKLQESERRLSTLMSNLPGMAYRCRNDRNWTMEFVSRGSFEVTGYWPSELIQSRMVAFGDLIHPDDRKAGWDIVQEAVRDKKPFQFVYRIVTARREEKWVWEQGQGVYDADGNLEALEGFITDITEPWRVSEELRGEKEFVERLISTAQAIVLVLDTEGRIERFNPYMERISGYRLEEVQGKDWFATFLPERDWARIRDLFKSGLAGAGTYGNNPIVTREGLEREIEWSNTVLKDADGKVVGVLAIGQDITERKKAEAWLERLIETTQDGVVAIDQRGFIVLFNPAAERIFGYSPAEVMGKKVGMLMVEPYASEHDWYITRYEQTGERRAIGTIRVVEGRRKSGEVFPIELSVTEVKTGDEVRYAAFIRDVSDKGKLQERLIESERLAAIGAASAAFAHEIGNPLNGMFMTVQLLERRLAREGGAEEAAVGMVQKLKDEIRRLTGLLQDFSSFARRETYVFKPVSLATVAGEVFAMEEGSYRARGIRVEQDFPADLPLVVADRDKLKQAMLNLCKNAVEAMPEGGTLTVEAHDARGEVMLEIADTGAGIADGVDVFAPFTTTKTTGTGLGLMVVRQIVAAHGGTISYTSEHGKGTTFRISLPVASL